MTTQGPKNHAATIAEHFRAYNEEFGRITRRAALNFLAEDWQSAQDDSVARIELYEEWVTRCVAAVAADMNGRHSDVAVWSEIRRAYEMLVARKPDSDFYRTFFNSISRDFLALLGSTPTSNFARLTSDAHPVRYRFGFIAWRAR